VCILPMFLSAKKDIIRRVRNNATWDYGGRCSWEQIYLFTNIFVTDLRMDDNTCLNMN